MKVKIPIEIVKIIDKIIDASTGSLKDVTIDKININVGIGYTLIKIDKGNRYAIIEIDPKDLDKIKDKVLEIIES